jgi:transcriptional regulator GlxA family with amidase domain
MAARAGLSPSRFAARFKATYGMPPHRYLLEMRVAHAGELLRSTPLSQEEIAAYCGFADIHHFSKRFKRCTGMTPGAYRNVAEPKTGHSQP